MRMAATNGHVSLAHRVPKTPCCFLGDRIGQYSLSTDMSRAEPQLQRWTTENTRGCPRGGKTATTAVAHST
eukprot:3474141-Lingulodinium_polyedra.AAC.1